MTVTAEQTLSFYEAKGRYFGECAGDLDDVDGSEWYVNEPPFEDEP